MTCGTFMLGCLPLPGWACFSVEVKEPQKDDLICRKEQEDSAPLPVLRHNRVAGYLLVAKCAECVLSMNMQYHFGTEIVVLGGLVYSCIPNCFLFLATMCRYIVYMRKVNSTYS